ncbi:MAG: HPr family phosphocarrier protein [Alteromonadaceae bacterium]|nr:HPr family phosphocarrier protein [Alteromonadaceae bacterium]
MPIVSEALTIVNRLGLHARPATQLAKISGEFNSTITLQIGDKTADASSVLGLMLLAGSQGKVVLVTVEGDDAEEAFEAVKTLFCTKFLEEDK